MDLHLDGEIEAPDFRSRKRDLVNEKIALETRLKLVSREGVLGWLEPMRKFINAVRERSLPTAGGDLLKLREMLAKVGSNLRIDSRNVLWDWIPPYAILADRGSSFEWQGRQESNPRLRFWRPT